ncbi:MAG: hypothetical protein ACN4G0_05330 [Polyangiales bacterium]
MGQRMLLAVLLSVLAGACSPYLHSPPARMLPLETAASLPKGDIAIQAAGGGGAATWGPSVGAGTLQARFGVGHNLEVAGEGSVARIGKRDTEWDTSARQSIFAGRGGFKYAPVNWFAVQAGFGGGGSAAGGFISPDAGIIFSYQGKAVVPFVGSGFFYSHPINPKAVLFYDDRGNREVLLPDQTFGVYTNLGVRVPFSHKNADAPRTAVMFAYRFMLASHSEYAGSDLYQDRVQDFYHLGVVSLDFVLGKQPDKPSNGGRRWKLR